MDKQTFLSLAKSAEGTTLSVQEFHALMERVEKHIPGKDMRTTIMELMWEDARGDLTMWVHEMDPEHCSCSECGRLRVATKQIRERYEET